MKVKKSARYEQVLQELKGESGLLMAKYASRLHKAAHDDNSGVTLSHLQMVRKIQKDCICIYTEVAHGVTFSGEGEEEVVKEILEYNYDMADIEYIRNKENINLCSHLGLLNENCIKRTDPEWSLFGIHELLQNGKVNPGPVGSKRTQFCKCCGEQIYVSREPGR